MEDSINNKVPRWDVQNNGNFISHQHENTWESGVSPNLIEYRNDNSAPIAGNYFEPERFQPQNVSTTLAYAGNQNLDDSSNNFGQSHAESDCNSITQRECTQVNNYSENQADYLSNQHQLQTVCTSQGCAMERARLQTEIHKLSNDFQLLLFSNKQTRDKLIKKELELGVAQDSCKRVKTDLINEISLLNSKIWMLESESKNLKTDTDTYKHMLVMLNKKLLEINWKMDKLGELNLPGDESRFYSIDNSFNPSNSELISRIQFKLDNMIQQKTSSQYRSEMYAQTTPILEHSESEGISETGQRHQSEELKDELPRIIYHDENASTECLPPGEHTGNEDNNSATFSERFDNECELGPGEIMRGGNGDNAADENWVMHTSVEENQFVSQNVREDDSDDDITIVEEIKRPFPVVVSSTSIVTDPSQHNSSVGSHDCAVCNKRFLYAEQLDEHLQQMHSIIVLDSCKVCGEMFSKNQLKIHEMSMHGDPPGVAPTAESSMSLQPPPPPQHTMHALASAESVGLTCQQRCFTVTSTATGFEQASSSSSSPSPLLGPVRKSVTLSPYARENNNEAMGRIDQNDFGLPGYTTTTAANPKPDLFNSLIDFSHKASSSEHAPSGISLVPSSSSYYIHSTETQAEQGDCSHLHGFDESRNVPGDFVWCICGSKYTSKLGLRQHIKTQTESTNYICGSCNRRFASFRGVKKHLMTCPGSSV